MTRQIEPGSWLLDKATAEELAQFVFSIGLHPGVRPPKSAIRYANSVLAGRVSDTGREEEPAEPVTHDEVCEGTTVGTTEAARILGMTPRRVCQLADDGRIPATKPAGRWLFQLDDIECFRDYRDYRD